MINKILKYTKILLFIFILADLIYNVGLMFSLSLDLTYEVCCHTLEDIKCLLNYSKLHSSLLLIIMAFIICEGIVKKCKK